MCTVEFGQTALIRRLSLYQSTYTGSKSSGGSGCKIRILFRAEQQSRNASSDHKLTRSLNGLIFSHVFDEFSRLTTETENMRMRMALLGILLY